MIHIHSFLPTHIKSQIQKNIGYTIWRAHVRRADGTTGGWAQRPGQSEEMIYI